MQSPIKSVDRTFDILELFRKLKRPVGVREVAERLGYPAISAAALMKSLQTLGYLRYERDTHVYFPTMKLPLLVDWIYESTHHGRRGIQLAERIAKETGETILLAVRNDLYSSFIHLIPAQYEIQVNPVGVTRRPLCSSGMGIALLSVLPDDAIRRIYQRTNRRLRKGEFQEELSLDEVLAYVAETRRRGYFYTHELTTTGAGLIAMPLPDAEDGAHMAVSVSGIRERMEANRTEIVRVMNRLIKRYAQGGGKRVRAAPERD